MGLRGSNGKKERGQLRFCCDFRYLNAVTKKGAYPIPRIDESLSKLGDAKFFITLDLGSAFWQVPLRRKDRENTGLACELGVLPMEEDALWLVQRHNHFSKTDGSGFDQSDEDVREPCDVLRG